MQQTSKQRERMKRVFSIVKQVEMATRPSKKTVFNETELQLLKELMFADMENKKSSIVKRTKSIKKSRTLC